MLQFERQSETYSEDSWKDTTQQDHDSVKDFLKDHAQTPIEQRSRYDSLTELHFSGTNTTVNERISDGSAKILYIKRFPNIETPKQIHIVFEGEGAGHNIDVYLKGRALNNYLEFFQKKSEINQ
ncbi:MAG: hypothetical protein IPK84_03425 [Candidatus Moraniibacteriota bacterium]|nr:MAG: hypothetical protein IPK84_03425 [Candidatus Moranbacteria bacterium]